MLCRGIFVYLILLTVCGLEYTGPRGDNATVFFFVVTSTIALKTIDLSTRKEHCEDG